MTLSVSEITLHGHTFSYRMAGSGPALVLLHGITCSSETWEEIIPALVPAFSFLSLNE